MKNKAWDKILDEDNKLIFGTSNIKKNKFVSTKKTISISQSVKHDQSFSMENPTRTYTVKKLALVDTYDQSRILHSTMIGTMRVITISRKSFCRQ